MKKVLIVTYYWPPGGGSGVQRWLKFSRYLPEYGWQPIIFTVDNPQYQLNDESLQEETLSGIEVHRLKAFDPNDIYNKWFGSTIGKPNIGFTSTKKESMAFKLVKWIRGNSLLSVVLLRVLSLMLNILSGCFRCRFWELVVLE